MRLLIHDSSGTAPTEFSDTKTIRVEERLNEFVASLVEIALGMEGIGETAPDAGDNLPPAMHGLPPSRAVKRHQLNRNIPCPGPGCDRTLKMKLVVEFEEAPHAEGQ